VGEGRGRVPHRSDERLGRRARGVGDARDGDDRSTDGILGDGAQRYARMPTRQEQDEVGQ
jgi:hypothetical protein